MRLSTSKNKISYYHYQVPCKSGGTYISRKNEVLIQKLAQKSYNEKVLSYAEKRLRYVRQLADIYEDSGIEEIFCKEHPARKKWISPIEPTWEQRVAEWSNEQYQGKGFKETDSVIYTERGERVRSKSEKSLQIIFIVIIFHISMSTLYTLRDLESCIRILLFCQSRQDENCTGNTMEKWMTPDTPEKQSKNCKITKKTIYLWEKS